MKKFLPGLLFGLIFGGAVTWLWLTPHGGAKPDADDDAPAKAEKAAAAKPGEGLHLDAAQLAQAGLQVAPPKIESVSAEVDAYGHVLDPVPLVTAAADLATARAALAASEKEFARTKSLHDSGDNASAQAVETAEAAAQRDRVQLDAARAKLAAAWGPELARRLDSASPADAFGATWTLARLDLPPDESVAAHPATAKISLLVGPADWHDAEVLGPATAADPQLQGRGFLVLVRGTALPTGAALRALLPGTAAAQSLPVVLRSALVRNEGSVFVYVQTGEGVFDRRRVELGRALADGIAVTSGVGEHDRVVVVGAQQLLSTELGGGEQDD